MHLPTRLTRFLESEEGPTAAEYALMIGVIVIVIAGAVSGLGQAVSGWFSSVSSAMN